MNRTQITFSSLLATALLAGATPQADGGRLVRPEGYLRFEGESDGGVEPSSFSVVPALPANAGDDPSGESATPPPEIPIPTEAPPAPPKPRPSACQRYERRFTTRLAEVRGTSVAPDGEPLSPMVQRALFGRTALRAGEHPAEALPELTWDSDLRDFYRAYQKCLKTEERRGR